MDRPCTLHLQLQEDSPLPSRYLWRASYHGYHLLHAHQGARRLYLCLQGMDQRAYSGARPRLPRRLLHRDADPTLVQGEYPQDHRPSWYPLPLTRLRW